MKEVVFCRACGLPLNPELRKWNRRFQGQEGAHRVYCNEACRQAYDRGDQHKQPPKYGVAAI
jgi:hypothetical protein